MFKKKVDIYNLRVGDCLATDIYTKDGVLAIAKGTPLTPFLIQKIKNLESKLVTIDIEKVYSNSIEQCKKILDKVLNENTVDIKEVEIAIEPFIYEVSREKNILRLLLELQNQDDYTFQHTIHVGIMSMVIARLLGFNKAQLQSIALAGTLHDIGKVKISYEIINKPSKLTVNEFDEIKKHPIYGYEILRNSEISRDIQLAALMHHEKCDGTGYPQKLRKDEITLFAKIVAVADVFHALNSNRSYKKKISPYDALNILAKQEIGGLDTEIVYIFVEYMLNYLISNKVRLSNGFIGEVTYVDKNYINQPLIKVEDKYIDLKVHKNLKIVEIVEV